MYETIQIKRGLEAKLPRLADGEPAFTEDSHKLFIGSANGNIQIVNPNIIVQANASTAQLADMAIDITQSPYNCLPNGTDISAILDSAWTKANQTNVPILIPSGTYTCSYTPTLDNVVLMGAGIGKTILKAPDGTKDPLNLSGRTNIKVVGITFDGNKTVNTGSNVAVECGSAINLSFYECEFTNASDSGARISAINGVIFDKCKFDNNGTSAMAGNGGDGIITYNNPVYNARIVNCDFSNNWRNGISFDITTDGKALVEKCTFTGNTRGIHIEQSGITFNAKITDCHSYSNTGTAYGANTNYGFYVGGNSTQFFNVSFKGCSAYNNNFGFLLYQAEGVKLVDCDGYGNTSAGISFGNSSYNTVTGGSFINNGLYGVSSATGFTNNMFHNVLIGDTRTTGATQTYGVVLKIYDGQNIFRDCIFYGNTTGAVSDSQAASVTSKTQFINCTNIAESTAWIDATSLLQNSWTNLGSGFQNISYRKDSMGYVEIRGSLKSGTVTANTIIFTLPTGYRPLNNRYYILPNAGSTITLVVNSNGTVTVDKSTYASGQSVGLDGIRFEAEQ